MNKTADVIWDNVWTTEGKRVKGDVVTLPAAEIASLVSIGAIQVQEPPKPKKQKRLR